MDLQPTAPKWYTLSSLMGPIYNGNMRNARLEQTGPLSGNEAKGVFSGTLLSIFLPLKITLM